MRGPWRMFWRKNKKILVLVAQLPSSTRDSGHSGGFLFDYCGRRDLRDASPVLDLPRPDARPPFRRHGDARAAHHLQSWVIDAVLSRGEVLRAELNDYTIQENPELRIQNQAGAARNSGASITFADIAFLRQKTFRTVAEQTRLRIISFLARPGKWKMSTGCALRRAMSMVWACPAHSRDFREAP